MSNQINYQDILDLSNHPSVKAIIVNGANDGETYKINSGSGLPVPDDVIEKRRQTLLKFLTKEEQLKYGDTGVLVQIEKGMETKQVLDWFRLAEQDLGAKCFLAAAKCNGEDENWCNGWLGSRWSDMTINNRFVRVAFYERSEDPAVFEKYSDWRILYEDDGEPARYRVKAGQHKYLLVINPYYHDETNDNWKPTAGVFATCCLCFHACEDQFGNCALPLENGKCCNMCNVDKVIPARIFVNANPGKAVEYLEHLEAEASKLIPKAKTKEVRYEQALRKMNELVKDGLENKDADEVTIDFITAVRKIAIDENEANEFIVKWQTDFRRTPGVNEFVGPPEDKEGRRIAVLRMIKESDKRGLSFQEIKDKIFKMCNGVLAEGMEIMREYCESCEKTSKVKQQQDKAAAAELKKQQDKAAAAEAKLLRELDAEPKPVKAEKKKEKKANKFACPCGDKNCMPRPSKTAWVNGVKRDQTFLQRAWDNKHQSSGKHSDSSSDI